MGDSGDLRDRETEPLGDTTPVGDGDAAGDGAQSAPGGTIGRFVILGALGRGGMGVVLVGYDPALDRKVAIKLLRPDVWRGSSESEGRLRLQREAMALAKLSHPNVVTVHEVGTVGEQLFIAMEFVEGRTLREWLGDGEHSWRDIVRMFAAAGRGLQAAHDAGFVHRDFKPENVLIGSDGRPRVLDFGLVTIPQTTDAQPAVEAGATRVGAIVGTPEYMSPEQLTGKRSDAQSDQFSFCVALYEALFDQLPFPTNPEAHSDAIARGAIRIPSRRNGVPAWITDIVMRGLAGDPSARWPSMGALLEALALDRAERRRRWTFAATASLLVLGSAVATGVWLRHSRAPHCRGAAARLAGVWDAERRDQVEHAFAATRLSFAHQTFVNVAALLDRYTGAWVAMHEEACVATHVEGRQSDSMLDLRMACLERQRATLRAMTDVWAAGVDANAVENAVAAASTLPSVDECADASALAERMPLPSDPAARTRIEATHAELDRVRALRDAHRLQEARADAEATRRQADATGFAPVRAEAALLHGDILRSFGDPAAAEPLQEAAQYAAAAHNDRLAATAMTDLIAALAGSRQAPSAILLAPLAEASVIRAGNRPEQRGALLYARGLALEDMGQYTRARSSLSEARALFLQALGAKDPSTLAVGLELARAADGAGDYATARALAAELLSITTAALGPDHPQTGNLLRTLGRFTMHGGDRGAARPLYDRALAIAERSFGPDSLNAALVINDLGVLAEAEGDLAEAERDYERVLAIRRRLLGPEHPLVAHALANLSIVRRMSGRLDEALAQVQEALGIMTRTYGPAHPDVAFETGLLGDVLAARGDVAGARARYQHALDIWNQIKGPETFDTLMSMVGFAMFEERHGNCRAARTLAEPAIVRLEKIGGPDFPEIGDALDVVGRCDLRERAPAALAHLERAFKLKDRPQTSAARRREIWLDLQRARHASGETQQGAARLASFPAAR